MLTSTILNKCDPEIIHGFVPIHDSRNVIEDIVSHSFNHNDGVVTRDYVDTTNLCVSTRLGNLREYVCMYLLQPIHAAYVPISFNLNDGTLTYVHEFVETMDYAESMEFIRELLCTIYTKYNIRTGNGHYINFRKLHGEIIVADLSLARMSTWEPNPKYEEFMYLEEDMLEISYACFYHTNINMAKQLIIANHKQLIIANHKHLMYKLINGIPLSGLSYFSISLQEQELENIYASGAIIKNSDTIRSISIHFRGFDYTKTQSPYISAKVLFCTSEKTISSVILEPLRFVYGRKDGRPAPYIFIDEAEVREYYDNYILVSI